MYSNPALQPRAASANFNPAVTYFDFVFQQEPPSILKNPGEVIPLLHFAWKAALPQEGKNIKAWRGEGNNQPAGGSEKLSWLGAVTT